MANNKYWTLFKIIWQNELVFRFGLVAQTLRSFITSFTTLTVWTVIFTPNNNAFGYSNQEMNSYLFLTIVIQTLVASSSLDGVAQEIYSGTISNYLIKPINIFKLMITREISNKLKRIFFLVIEITLLYLIFQPTFFLPNHQYILIFITWLLAGSIVSFLISLLLSSIGFWSPEVWAPRFLLITITEATAGKFFPIDILPSVIQKLIYLTPMPYLSFIQTQLFLNKLNNKEIVIHSFIFLAWIIILLAINHKVWQKGFKSFQATGQ